MFLLADVHPQWKMWGPFWKDLHLPAGMLLSPLGFLTRLTSRLTSINGKSTLVNLHQKRCSLTRPVWKQLRYWENWVFFFPVSSVFFVCVLLNLSLMGRVTHQHCPCVTPVSPAPATKDSCHKGHERPVEKERTNEKQHHEWTKLLKIYLLVQFTAVSSLNEC